MGTDDAFAELGLASGASEREVKAAWRRLASRWHPDRNGSADAVVRMQRINQAFEEIRRSGFHVVSEAASTTASTTTTAAADDAASEPADESQARHGRPDAEPSPDQDTDTRPPRRPIHRKVKLTLEEAAAGCIKVLRGKLTGNCTRCEGAGHQVLGGNCAQCGGSGAVPRRSFFGWPTGVTECEACLGGGIARRPCAACRGSGKAPSRSYQVKVRMPQGVRHGDLLHVDGRRLRSGPLPVDLEIRVEILPHALFTLDDDCTLRCEVPVDGFAWIAERPVQVPTLAGVHPMQPSRSQVSYRLEGQGFPVKYGGAPGDLWVTLVPVFPQHLSNDQHILLDQLCATALGAGGHAVDERLRAWQKDLRARERGMRG